MHDSKDRYFPDTVQDTNRCSNLQHFAEIAKWEGLIHWNFLQKVPTVIETTRPFYREKGGGRTGVARSVTILWHSQLSFRSHYSLFCLSIPHSCTFPLRETQQAYSCPLLSLSRWSTRTTYALVTNVIIHRRCNYRSRQNYSNQPIAGLIRPDFKGKISSANGEKYIREQKEGMGVRVIHQWSITGQRLRYRLNTPRRCLVDSNGLIGHSTSSGYNVLYIEKRGLHARSLAENRQMGSVRTLVQKKMDARSCCCYARAMNRKEHLASSLRNHAMQIGRTAENFLGYAKIR